MLEQPRDLRVAIGVQPLVGDARPGQELTDVQRLRRKLRADHADRGSGVGHEQRSPGNERRQDDASEPRVGGHQLAEPVSRDRDHFAAGGDPSRDEDAEPTQHAQLTEEPTGSMVDDGSFLIVDGDHHVDLRAHEDEEVVRDVALAVEILARVDPASIPKLRDQRHVRCVQRGGCFVLVRHGVDPTYPNRLDYET